MPDKHSTSFDYFDLNVEVTDEGSVNIEFVSVEKGVGRIAMEWDTLREVIEFVGKHGLDIDNPWFGEYVETVEGAEVSVRRARRLRFTERGAECREVHVRGYTGPICSCEPLTCKAIKASSTNERFDPGVGSPFGAYSHFGEEPKDKVRADEAQKAAS